MPDYLSACCLVGHEGWDFINAKVIQGRTFQRCEEENKIWRWLEKNITIIK